MTAKQHQIGHINDLLALSQEELVRMIPDLLLWHQMMREMAEEGVDSVCMVWVDDGRPAEVFSVEMHIKGTGEIQEVRGPAFVESQQKGTNDD